MKIKTALLNTAAVAALGLGSLTPAVANDLGKHLAKLSPTERQHYIRDNHAAVNAWWDAHLVKFRSRPPEKLTVNGLEFYATNAMRDGDWLINVYVSTLDFGTPFTADVMAYWKRETSKKACAAEGPRDMMLGGYGFQSWLYNNDQKTVLGHVEITAADCAELK